MSTLPSPPSTLTPRAGRGVWPHWLREPLLHFLLLGGMLFAADRFLNADADDARLIVIDESVDSEALRVFKEARGRAPSEDELYALRRVWLDNEVLYREGLALQMDKGDKAIKDRVIFKALSMINAGLKPPPVDDDRLREWFEKNRARYNEPARFDFQEAVLSGDSSESAARAFAAALNAGTPGDVRAGLRVFSGRPHANIVQSYGADFSKALEESPPGEWRALRHGDSWRVMRLEARTAARPASYETLRGVVLQDWTDAVMAEQRTAAVRALARKYTIKVEASTP